MRAFITVPAALMLAVGAPPVVSAQTLSGQVVDSITRAPVGAGFVVLLDTDGAEIIRTLTSRDGRFTFTLAPNQRGPLRLRSERIGFHVTVTEPFAVPRQGALAFTLWVGALPTPLSAIEVRESTECTVRPTEEEQTAVVWEEARKALAAASWTASQQRYRVITNVYERDLDRRRRVLREQHRASTRLTATPFRSRDPEALVREGYVVMEEQGATYYAPDAHVLQDDAFLSTHCFRLRRPDDERSPLIGLAFEPAPGRDLPDVEGVLWLDGRSSELRSLEYRYTNLPRALRADDPGGGTVEFMPLPTGAWIVHRWHIVMPTAFREERVNPFAREARRVVVEVRETGGEVLAVTDTTGVTVYQVDLAEIIGVVVDSSVRGQPPLAGATVEIAGTWFSTTTNQQGVFRLGAVLDGEQGVTFSHPRIDSLAFTPPLRVVTLARGRTDTLRLAIPPMLDILATHCPDVTQGATARVLVGTVRDSSTAEPTPGIDVVAVWQRTSGSPGDQSLQAVARTHKDGTYAICTFEVGRPAIVFAVREGAESELMHVVFETTGVNVGGDHYRTSTPIWRQDLTLRPRGTQPTIAGVVTDRASGHAVAGALVSINGTDLSATTDATGVFRLRGVASGTRRLTVRRLGYALRWGDVEVHDDQPTIISAPSLMLTPVPQVAGTITEPQTYRPVADAWVILISDQGDSVAMTRSDDSGGFVLTAPEPGPYYVAARRIGYTPGITGPFQLRTGRAIAVEFSLSPAAFGLELITVTGKPAVPFLSTVGFYARQREGFGIFLDREAIERQPGASQLGHLLQAVPGIAVDAGGIIRPRGIVTGGSLDPRTFCHAPLVWVDGMRIEPVEMGAGGGMITLNSWTRAIHPIHIEAIEVYRSPAEIPAQYNTGGEAACGVILIWTRRGGY